MSSIHFIEGELSIEVHTVGNVVLRFERDASMPDDYSVFKQRLRELLSSPDGKNDIGWSKIEECPLERLVEGLGVDAIIVLSPKGQMIPLRALLNELHHLDVAIIIGGFPEGDYRSDAYSIAHHVVSLGEEEMTVPSVVREILGALEH